MHTQDRWRVKGMKATQRGNIKDPTVLIICACLVKWSNGWEFTVHASHSWLVKGPNDAQSSAYKEVNRNVLVNCAHYEKPSDDPYDSVHKWKDRTRVFLLFNGARSMVIGKVKLSCAQGRKVTIWRCTNGILIVTFRTIKQIGKS